MIRHPAGITAVLLGLVAVIFFISSQDRFKRYFCFLPAVFWIYFIPMGFSNLGFIDPQSGIYQNITNWVLPASLVVLLLSSDLQAIVRLGQPAMIMMLAGSLGIILGMPLVFGLFKPWVGPQMWSGFGALSGSWVGGSANMIAVKEAIATPENIFSPMVIVDTVVPYMWLGALVAVSGFQRQFDRLNHSDLRIVDDISRRVAGFAQKAKDQFSWRAAFLIFVLAGAGAVIARTAGMNLPVVKDVLSPYAWTIIAASALGIVLSLTPARKLEHHGASKIGYFLLYFVLTTIGAKASFGSLGSTLVLIAAGFLVVLIHGCFVLLAARIIRAPMFLVVVASQANIGGVASAPIIAEVYRPGLASVGLLLAIFGNITGTYLGMISAQLCRLVSGITL